jgi:hypothetical protein
MDTVTNNTAAHPRKELDLAELEGRVTDLVRLTRIADGLVEQTLALHHGEEFAPGYRNFRISDAELDDIAFMLGEAQYRARLLSEAFYATLEAAR